MEKKTLYTFLSKGKVTILFLILYICSMIIGNIIINPRFLAESNGIPLLDSTFNYTPESAYILFESLSETGRLFYLKFLLMFDLINPIIVFSFFSSLFLFMLKKSGKSFNKILLFTFGAFIMDLFENAFLSFSIIRYPNHSNIALNIANFFTIAKTIAVVIYPIITIALFIVMLIGVRKKIKTTYNSE